ncbi:unnamed protein product [Clavelina lepadiformis]|uniref:Uncharacterized protein n=2 Tax=Clavelina lepadiformis TaxID=159417 RepID=A0ABP0FFJ4_CLALP
MRAKIPVLMGWSGCFVVSQLTTVGLLVVAQGNLTVHRCWFRWVGSESQFAKGWSASSAELMQLLLTCSKQHPTVCDTEFLKTSKWLPSKTKHKNIIASHSFKHLAQVIAKTTMYHPNIDQFAREIVTTIGSLGTDALGTFWDQHLTPTLFSSSPERKYLGFMLAVFSFDLISSKEVPAVWSKDLLNNLYYALTNKENPLHLVCRNELPKILSEKLSQENVSHEVQLAVVFQTFTSPGGLHLDGITHSAIVTSLVSRFKLPALLNYIQWLKHLFIHGTTDKTMIREINLDVARKWSSSHLLHLIRMTSLPRNEKWISSIVRFLLLHSHFSFLGNDNNSHIDEISMVGEHFMDLSESTRSHVHQNFLTSVSWLSNMAPLPPDETSVVTNEPKVVIPGLMSSGHFWLASIVDFADSLVSSEHVKPVFNFNDNIKKSWLDVVQNISKVLKLKSKFVSSWKCRR